MGVVVLAVEVVEEKNFVEKMGEAGKGKETWTW